MIEHTGSFQPSQETSVSRQKILSRETVNEQEISEENKQLIGEFLRYLKKVGRQPNP